MDYLSNNVAVNLKRIRKSKSMSLDKVSEPVSYTHLTLPTKA